jgi:hypothetical protein
MAGKPARYGDGSTRVEVRVSHVLERRQLVDFVAFTLELHRDTRGLDLSGRSRPLTWWREQLAQALWNDGEALHTTVEDMIDKLAAFEAAADAIVARAWPGLPALDWTPGERSPEDGG